MRSSPPGAKPARRWIHGHGDRTFGGVMGMPRARRPLARCVRTRTNEMNLIQQLEAEQISKLAEGKNIPDFRAGDTVRVGVRVVEGERTRVQFFAGVCIARANQGVSSLGRASGRERGGQ